MKLGHYLITSQVRNVDPVPASSLNAIHHQTKPLKSNNSEIISKLVGLKACEG